MGQSQISPQPDPRLAQIVPLPVRRMPLREVRDVPEPPQPGIFISYRHADALPHARLLQVNLRERLPDAPVFMDLDSIEAGLDFAKVITDAINSSGVMLVLIGPQWEKVADRHGHRRLDDPGDCVRFEVRTAIKRGIRVIPVLVEGAKPPRQQELPRDLRKLARLNALEMSCDHRYQYDADRLMNVIERALGQ
jgi:hypothetical protein